MSTVLDNGLSQAHTSGMADMTAHAEEDWSERFQQITVFVEAAELPADHMYRVTFPVLRHAYWRDLGYFGEEGVTVFNSNDASECAADVDAHRHCEIVRAAEAEAEKLLAKWCER